MGTNFQGNLHDGYRSAAGNHRPDRRQVAVGSIFAIALLLLSTASLAEARSARGGSWLWTLAADGHHVTGAKGEQQLLDLTAEAQLSDFAGSADGWLATVIDRASRRPALKVLRGDAATSWELPTPPINAAELRSAMLAANDKGLHGIAWLEGANDRQLAVKAATWLGHAWSTVETVAGAGPGSQLSLSSAQLADGSWLLLWSAFDGNDDEIVWSHHAATQGWSPPQRLGNGDQVPDITPRLVALADGGAVAAWSGYVAGHYRLHTARFAAGEWSQPEIVGGEGTVAPSFELDAGRTFLLYRRAVPRGWVVAELNAAGKLARRAEFSSAVAERPTLKRRGEARVELRWPGAKNLDSSLLWHAESP